MTELGVRYRPIRLCGGLLCESLTVFDISGIDSPSANIESLAAGRIETSETLHSAGDIVADGGVNVGTGGIKSDGPVSGADLLNLAPSDSAPDFAVDGDIYFGSDGNLHLFNGLPGIRST